MSNASGAENASIPPATLKPMANALRVLAMDAVQKANSGHPGMPMGMADVATVLFSHFLKYDPSQPNWPDRDRFVLSAGHGSMLLYGLLHLTGYEDMTLEALKNFRQLGAKTAGHPEYGHAQGIETTTGPLGQGLATAVGMAIAERSLAARYGSDLIDHYTYTIAGDGCLMEGISQEAITLAGHLRLDRLIVLFDDNGISIDGDIALTSSDDQLARFKAAGWHVQQIDGHDFDAIAKALEAAKKEQNAPSLIACKTVIGFGAPTKAGTAATHGAPLGEEEIAGTRKALGWENGPFELPDAIATAWKAAGARHQIDRAAWEQRLQASPNRALFDREIAGDLPEGWDKTLDAHIQAMWDEQPKEATRKSSERCLGVLAQAVPEMLGGSADLTGSNNTKAKSQDIFSAKNYGGQYIHYGIREHAMAAAMNGIALHGGAIPYGGTFLVFADYARPAIRLAALMGQRVIHVLTHDSIGLGEDGPTHQPVETIASLRAIPNVCVFRPADAVETAECWGAALENVSGPSVLALTRQGLPTLRKSAQGLGLSAKGAYVLSEAEGGPRQATLLATGSEVSLALEAQTRLKENGIAVAVVSMPCWELFAQQDAAYRQEVLGTAPRIAIEAALGFGWERWLGDTGVFIGMEGFGASAPAGALFKHFGITADALVEAVKKSV